MINNINVILIIFMLELLKLSPVIPGFGFKQFAERVLRKEFCGKSFAERVLRKESCGKSPVGCGLSNSTMLIEQQVRRNELQSLRKEFCGKSQKIAGPYFPILVGLHRKQSPAVAGRCPRPAPPPLSRSRTSATFSEKGSHLEEKLRFYGPSTVHYPLYRGRHPHLGLKS